MGPVNQCDGCLRGLPYLEGTLIHQGHSKWDTIYCTKDRYTIERKYNLIQRYLKKPTRKKAIEAFCFHCIGGTEEDMPESGYQREIRECSSVSCPLYRYRPFKGH